MEELAHVFDHKVWIATIATWAISFSDINGILTAIATIVTIAYTVYKWATYCTCDKNEGDGNKSK